MICMSLEARALRKAARALYMAEVEARWALVMRILDTYPDLSVTDCLAMLQYFDGWK